ncbi:MAG: homocysteine S-methyltransferase family protein [Oscillospiraceae bacterium]|nr:homocysteine S-methyltransferase family protein [Oscillospiraceae bacterium]
MLDLTTHHLFDGGMGTMLQTSGLPAGTPPERLNLTAPETVEKVHAAYRAVGADIITANTFGASRRKLGEDPAPIIAAGVAIARRAAGPERYAALDVGPLGALLEPFGNMTFDEAYTMFAEIMEAGAAAGADLILIETMSDLLEAKAALLAAKEKTNLPVFVTMTFGEDGRTFLGVDPAAAAVTLTALGADAIGVNCSAGPQELRPVLQEILGNTHLPVIIQPNAGLPQMVDGKTVYDVEPEEFARWGRFFLEDGASILGGCCGTTPAHIQALRTLLDSWEGKVKPRRRDGVNRLCGWQGGVGLTVSSIATVGERMNPTGRKKMKDALYAKDWEAAAEAAVWQEREGADFLVVNVGLPDIDDVEALPALILAIQKVSALPLVIDCSNPAALEKALRICRGRPVLNSVNGGEESMAAMLPLAVKYGTGLIVLALDGSGISPKAEDRRDTALRVAQAAERAGVRREDIWIDCLALAASVSQGDSLATPEAIRLVRQAGYKTVLGVSNVSYGLPGRDQLNQAYLAACLAAGLNVAIINTSSTGMMDTLAAVKVLTGVDKGCGDYIARFQKLGGACRPAGEEQLPLETLIVMGQRSGVPAAVEALLEKEPPLEIINGRIIPALDTVGERYEQGSLFLPQLMASAGAVKAAFDVVRAHLPQGAGDKGTILLATVKNDVHDIGKNIVKMLLENYGYKVIDLGRDVEPEAIVKAALETKAPLVGLSSLMTTTAQNIAVTIQALREAGAPCKVMVGGAVVTQEFADRIGADFYTKDAAQSARVAAQVFGK